MSDIKTVALNGNELCVKLSGRNCHMLNLGSETIYACVHAGIVPDADGVLGVPAGAAVTLHDTCGTVYLKGIGKIRLAGDDYNVNCFGSACSGGSGSSGGSEDPAENVTSGDIDGMFKGNTSDGSDIPESSDGVTKNDVDAMFE